MRKTLSILTVSVFMLALSASVTLAAPPEKTDGFVCPVIKTDKVLNSPKGITIGEGHYSILGPNVHVPVHATNANGAGTPPGPHSAPGDTDYTAIWAIQPE